MSGLEQKSIPDQEQVEKAINGSESRENSGHQKHGSIFPKTILEQLAIDPVEKGPFITVDNSPRSGRNMSVLKAKIREQESRHTLELLRVKKEYEVRENELTAELAGLRCSLSNLQEQLNLEVGLKQAVEEKEALASKKFLEASGKLGEVQGRYEENQFALREQRQHCKDLQEAHEKQLAEMRKQETESEEKHQELKRVMERNIRNLEDQLNEIQLAFQKVMTEKAEQWKSKEEELLSSLKQEEMRFEKLTGEKMELMENFEQTKIQLKEASEGRDSAIKEMTELREYHQAELSQIREDHANHMREWDGRMESVLAENRQVKEELDQVKADKEGLTTEKENSQRKHDESIKLLKDALTVLDEQNKELTTELKRLREKYEEKESVSATLASQVNSLLAERNETQSEQHKLLEDKSKLETELTVKTKEIADLTSQKDAEIRELKDDVTATEIFLTKQMEEKDTRIDKLTATIENMKKSMEIAMQSKDNKIQELTTKLGEERDRIASNAEEMEKMKEAVNNSTQQVEVMTGNYEGSKQQVAKLNLEMSRLINEVVNIKEENIDLKSGLNEALQKGEFYKDRNFSLTEQLAELKRDMTDKEAEWNADIQDKNTLIDYLQAQIAAASTAGASEKKRRRFFQTKSPATPTSPMKIDLQKPTTSSTALTRTNVAARPVDSTDDETT